MPLLGDLIIEYSPGFACSKSKLTEGGLIHLRPFNIGADGKLDSTQIYRVPVTEAPAAKRALQAGDILFNNTNSVELVGKVAIVEQDTVAGFSNHLTRLRVDRSKIEPTYLLYFLRWLWQSGLFAAKATRWVSQAAFKSDQLRAITLPLPLLPEQRRIVDILFHAEAIIRLQRQAVEKTREIIAALFLDMFGDPATNPMGWPMVEVSQFVSRFQGGKNFRAAGSEEEAGCFRILKVSAVTYGAFKPEESKPVPRDYLPPSDHLVRAGDLLFSRANTVELVGATAYVSSTPNAIILPDKLWRFIWNRAFKTEPLFVWALFQAPAIRHDLGRLATGTSGSMKNISQAKLLRLRVPMPPYTAQRSFADRLEACLAIQAGSMVATQHSEALFQSLLHRAFSGML